MDRIFRTVVNSGELKFTHVNLGPISKSNVNFQFLLIDRLYFVSVICVVPNDTSTFNFQVQLPISILLYFEGGTR
jgi:hypothetical protein